MLNENHKTAGQVFQSSNAKSSESDTSDSDNDEGDYNYKAMTESQKDKNKSLFKYIGKTIRDTNEKGDWFEAIVEDVVMEVALKTPCFKYFENGNEDDPQYIIAASALSDCEWVLEEKQNSQLSSSSTAENNSKKSKWKGWALVDDNEVRPLEDQLIIVDGKRRRKNPTTK